MQVEGKHNSAHRLNEKLNGHDSRGFSLIELLIVIAIILILAAIAIPNLIQARISANEAAAASSVRTITTAAVVYSTTYQNGYPPSIATLGPPPGPLATCDNADLVDPLLTLAPFQKSGYTYSYTGATPVALAGGCGAPGYQAYLVTAVPMVHGFTGNQSFCSDEPGVIHFNTTGAVIASSGGCVALPTLQ
jgi:prepilin-type N-terminal cleavage/methylation domain-containing protein